jgi:hypothetical protein
MVASEAERKTILSETGPVTPTAPDFPQALPQGARFPQPGALSSAKYYFLARRRPQPSEEH